MESGINTAVYAYPRTGLLYVLSLLTALLLPATFITGLFGINVKGLPWVEADYGAFFVALSCVGAALLTLVLLRHRGVIGD